MMVRRAGWRRQTAASGIFPQAETESSEERADHPEVARFSLIIF
jgi:hypothetical protein